MATSIQRIKAKRKEHIHDWYVKIGNKVECKICGQEGFAGLVDSS